MGSVKGRSEFFVAALLGVLAVLVAKDALQIPSGLTQSEGISPRFMPYLVSGLLACCAGFLTLDVLRGGFGEIEEGGDIDLGIPTNWRTPAILVAALLANMVLIETAGWIISGGLLFWLCAYAFGSREKRDPLIALTLSSGTYVAFYYGLQIYLPAGILSWN